MYSTRAFRWTGHPLAKLISNVGFPGANLLLPRNPLFDAAFYAKRYPDVARASKNLWAHYLAYGSDEGRQPHPLFHTAFYLTQNPDVSKVGLNPLIHYVEYGAKEGRDPRADFDTSSYLEDYPDVRRSGINPLLHFWLYGRAEGRHTSATASAADLPARAKGWQTSATAGTADLPAVLDGPSISVVMPTFNTPSRYLRLAIESVLRQDFPRWALCIHDDGSTSSETLEVLREYQRRDQRIVVQFGPENRGIASATNAALSLASGEYVAMLDHDDEILPEALSEVARALKADPAIDALYTDQAYIGPDDDYIEPFYRPDWSLEMFRGVMFVGHLLVVRRSLAEELGGFDPKFDRVQDFEFMLRVSEKNAKIHHLPKILYLWRRVPGSVAFHGNEKGPIEPLQAAAVNAHLERSGVRAAASPHPVLAHRLVIAPLARMTSPSVAVAVRRASPAVSNSECVRAILKRSTYSNLKVFVSETSSRDVSEDRRVEVGDAGRALNSSFDYVIWVNSYLEILTPNWIEHFLHYCEQPGVACVAPLIVQDNGTVGHAGLVLGMDGILGYPMHGWPADSDGYAGSLSCAREVTCVSGECMMVARVMLEALDGSARYYANSLFEGADLSLRGFTTGRRSIVTPRVVLRRVGTPRVPPGWKLDRALFADRWAELSRGGDPFYNPNFALVSPGYHSGEAVIATRASSAS
jgi:GT2 family glycosyltransferase